MKKLLTLALSIWAVSATAQTAPTYAAQTITVPIVASGNTSNSYQAGVLQAGWAPVMDVRKQQNVAIQWNLQSTTLVTGTNVIFKLSDSVDGLSWNTNKYSVAVNIVNAPNNVLITNINCAGVGYLRVEQVTATGVAATNEVKYGIKISAP